MGLLVGARITPELRSITFPEMNNEPITGLFVLVPRQGGNLFPTKRTWICQYIRDETRNAKFCENEKI